MQWGNWKFNKKNLTLTHIVENYEVDLEEIKSSAAILDWIFQIFHKSWADAETTHDLLQAFDDILNPQQNYCPSEEDRRTDGSQLAREFAKRRTTLR